MKQFYFYAADRARRQHNRRVMPVFLLVLSLVLVVSSLYGARASVFEKAREAVLDTSAPVLSFLSGPIRWVNHRIGYAQDYLNVLDQNKRLREENAALSGLRGEVDMLRAHIQYFERILEMNGPEAPNYIDAYAVGDYDGPYQGALIISAGRRHNVAVGDAVITDAGLVGHIISAAERASRVLLLTDFNSQLPVFVETAELEAILAGQHRKDPLLKFVWDEEAARITPGMRVVTSGAGGVMPRGIPVGVIDRIETHESGMSSIWVRLFAKADTTDRVRVVDYMFPTLEGAVTAAAAPPVTGVQVTGVQVAGGAQATGIQVTGGQVTGGQATGRQATGRQAIGQKVIRNRTDSSSSRYAAGE